MRIKKFSSIFSVVVKRQNSLNGVKHCQTDFAGAAPQMAINS